MLGVVALLLHEYDAPPLAVKVIVDPRHAVDPVEDIVAIGKALTVTAIALLEEEQPSIVVPMTE